MSCFDKIVKTNSKVKSIEKSETDLVKQKSDPLQKGKIFVTKSNMGREYPTTNYNIDNSLNHLDQEYKLKLFYQPCDLEYDGNPVHHKHHLDTPMHRPILFSIDDFSPQQVLSLGKIQSNTKIIPKNNIDGSPIYKQLDEQSINCFLFPKKAEALLYLYNYNWNSRLKLFSEDLNGYGAKRFILATKEHVYDQVISTRAHLYENIEMGQPVKLHIDLDYKTHVSDPFKLSKLFSRLVRGILELINKEIANCGINDPQVIILRSNQVILKNRENKVSGHIIYNNVIFKDIYQMKLFFLSLKSDLIDKKIIDKNIYRIGCFRMMGCSKKYKNNKLKFFKAINYIKPKDQDDLFYDTLVTQLTCKNFYTVHINDTIKERIAKKIKFYSSKYVPRDNIYVYFFSEIEYSKLVKLTAKIPPPACDDYIDWLLITFAFSDLYHNVSDALNYQNKIYHLWDNWCKSSKNYNEPVNRRYFHSLVLDYKDANHIPLSCNSKFRFKRYIKYQNIKGNFVNYKQICANERFLNRQLLLESINKHDILFIKSPTGTGKTSLLESLFGIEKDDDGKPIPNSRYNFNYPIISITPRKNLARKHSTDLLLDSYDDKNIYLFDSVKLAVTANSLVHVEEDNFRDGYIILDEFSPLLRYYKSRIMDGIRFESFKLLAKVVRYAKKVVVLDADLTHNNIDTLLTLRGSDNYSLYVNQFQNRTGTNAYFYDDMHAVAQMLIDDFKNKVPFVASFDSLTMMESLLSVMKKQTKSVEDAEVYDQLLKIYSSKHGSDLIDTNDWEDNCVMFTPSITIGIDHNSKEATRSYAFAFKDTLTAEDINQQIQRNRNQSEVHIFISPKVRYMRYPNEESFKLETKERINKYSETIKELEEISKRQVVFDESDELDDELNKTIIQAFNKMYVYTSYREETMKVNNRYYLQSIMKDMGYNIIECSKAATDGFKLKKGNSDDANRKIINKYFSANEIEGKAQQAIKRKLDIMKIKSDQVDDQIKDIIMNDRKFLDYLHLRKFVKGDMNDQIIDNYLRDFNETAANSIYIKLRYYKQLTDYLGIPKGLEYDYDRDKERFHEIVDDKKLLGAIEDIKRSFQIRGNKYRYFDQPNGFGRLYKMTISMCKQLFGNDILITKKSTVRIGKKIAGSVKHNLNDNFFNCVKNFLM